MDADQNTKPNVDMEALASAHIATCHLCNKLLRICIQNDIGANRCVTDRKDIIVGYKDIDAYPMGGIKKEDIAIVCTGKGYLPWYSAEGICTMVEIFYSANCDGTLISPTNMVGTNSNKYQGFVILSNCDNGTGHLKLLHRDGVTHCTYPMTRTNDLWYHMYDPPPQPPAVVNRLNDSCKSALWHGRLGCAGNNVMDSIHRHVIGIDKPLRRNPFYK